MRHMRCTKRTGDEGMANFATGRGDERLDRAFAAIGDRDHDHLGGGKHLPDTALECLGDGDGRNAAFIRVGGYDDTHDTPNEKVRVGVCYLAYRGRSILRAHE